MAGPIVVNTDPPRLVIFGTSNILSDLFDCALANRLIPARIVVHYPEQVGERDIPLSRRIEALAGHCPPPEVESLDEFQPRDGEIYILGPTTPTREVLAGEVTDRFGLEFHSLVHPTAYVSPLAHLGQGCFIGANSVIAPGARLAEHVFINRSVTVGHDTRVGAFTRVQPGSNLGGLSTIGRGVTIGLGATLVERLVIGDGAVIGAGAVVLADVAGDTLVVGIPAKVKRALV